VPVLIDGHNLLHAARAAGDPDRPVGKLMLMQALGQWAERTGERIQIVFDGPAPSPGLAQQLSHAGVAMSFSGGGVSADTVILDILQSDSAARKLLVVSSDRAIVSAARRRRARPMGSDVFWAKLQRDLARPPRSELEPEEKRRGLEPDATDAWLREFGLGEGTAE